MTGRAPARRLRGQSLVEVALVLPLFIILLVGLFDFGRAVFVYNAVSNAAREGARVAIVDQATGAIVAEAAAHSIGNVPAVSCTAGTPSCVSVRFLNLDLSSAAPCNEVPVPTGCIAEVRVDYRFEPLIPLGGLVGPITLSTTSRLQVEHSS